MPDTSEKVVCLFPSDKQRSTIADELDGLDYCLNDIRHYLDRMEEWNESGREHARTMVSKALEKATSYAFRARLIGEGRKLDKPR